MVGKLCRIIIRLGISFIMENTSTDVKRQNLMGSNAEEDLTVVEKARPKVEEEMGTILPYNKYMC